MQVTLNESELKICEWLGKSRYQNNRVASISDKKIGPQSVEETDLEGICGEFAFCKAMNLYPDMSINTRSGGYDILMNGLRVDVKTTKYKNGKLLAAKSKKISDSDLYVLVIGERPNYTIAGWCKSEHLIKNSNLVDLGYGLTYCLFKEKLSSIDAITKNI
jgi:hypothetical protein